MERAINFPGRCTTSAPRRQVARVFEATPLHRFLEGKALPCPSHTILHTTLRGTLLRASHLSRRQSRNQDNRPPSGQSHHRRIWHGDSRRGMLHPTPCTSGRLPCLLPMLPPLGRGAPGRSVVRRTPPRGATRRAHSSSARTAARRSFSTTSAPYEAMTDVESISATPSDRTLTALRLHAMRRHPSTLSYEILRRQLQVIRLLRMLSPQLRRRSTLGLASGAHSSSTGPR